MCGHFIKMGCWQACSKNNLSASNNEKIIQAINLCSVRRLRILIKYYSAISSVKDFDSLQIRYGKLVLNPLAICFYENKAELFQVLLDHKCSILAMEESLINQKIFPINFLCRQGYLDVLEKSRPYYLSGLKSQNKENETSLASKAFPVLNTNIFPIHLAAHNGNINIISFLKDYFSNTNEKLAEFDVNSLEEATGENCALIACKEGYFSLVKFLHETCGADFKILNDYKENAIMVCIAGMNKSKNQNCIDIIQYLIETVQVDFTYMYEEMLIMAQCPSLVSYLEEKLRSKEIFASKKSIDYNFPVATRVSMVVNPENCENIFTDSFVESVKNMNSSAVSTISYFPETFDEKSFDLV